MTFVGKILTFLVFVMSLVFMTASIAVYATHRNWREVVVNETGADGKPLGLAKQLANLQAQNEKIVKEKDELTKILDLERGARRLAIAAAESKRQLAQEELAKKTVEYTDLLAKLDKATEDLKGIEARVTQLTEANQKLFESSAASVTARDQALADLAVATDKVHELEGVRRLLAARTTELTGELSKQAAVLTHHNLTKDTPLNNTPPTLSGVIVDVGNSKFVEISLGADVGLRVGHEMEVIRAGTYLGRLIIRKTTPNRAVAEIIKETGRIQKGDRVFTKVS